MTPNNSPGSQLTDRAPTITTPTQPVPLPNTLRPSPPVSDSGPAGLPGSQPIELAPSGNAPGELLNVTRTADVQDIQRRLSELGTYSGGVNGNWSLQTQQALVDFQVANGLEPDRTLTKATQRQLFASTAIKINSTNGTTYTGEWAPDASQCQNTETGRAPISITPRRAEAFGTACEFNSVQRESSAWRIRSRCTDEDKTWIANIRLLRAANKLIWSSENGTTTYIQCIGTRPR